ARRLARRTRHAHGPLPRPRLAGARRHLPMSSNVTFAPGRRIGSYEMLVELASGGTATVGIAIYRGAEGFERLVVLKRVHRHLTKDREFMGMLLDEARLASSIRHANVVPVID